MMTFETVLLWGAALLFISVLSSRLSERLSIPVLLGFLAIGMLAGSEGIGGIFFENAGLAKSIGTMALVFIIFSGGFDTNWKATRPVVGPGLVLSTVGVLLTALIMGVFAVLVFRFTFLEGMLLGSIISSTDAAAVFAVLRSKRISLKPPLRPLLEFESGSNDPMAVFLTVGCIRLLTVKDLGPAALVPGFILDMGVGALAGYLMARFIVVLIRRRKLEYEGLYPVVMISLVLLTYGLAQAFKGNGFLAVYLAGLMLGREKFPNKTMIMRFHDGLAWLMQIAMFVTLGLLVYPSHLIPLIWRGLLITLLLMLVARPLSVALCLAPFRIPAAQKAMVAWVGLRGSVPIILATFPYMAGLSRADTIFNVVFFVVLASVFIQGTSIPAVARRLRLRAPLAEKINYPIVFDETEAIDAELSDVIVPFESAAVGKSIGELEVPEKCLILLISREGRFIIPSGTTKLEGGDVMLVLANLDDLKSFQSTIITPEKRAV